MTLFSFTEWWELLSATEKIFWGIASVSTFLLVLQTILSFMGADSDFDADGDFDAHGDYEVPGQFSMFSLKSTIAFLAFFGWAGVITLQKGWAIYWVLLAGVGAGVVAMFLVAYMLFQFQKIEVSGTMRIEQALDRVGEVYLTIPEGNAGTGEISIEVNGSMRELTAKTQGPAIATGQPVRVIDILEDNILLVELAPGLTEADKQLQIE
jgi:membrane protein implicated in regulation of membrane protease activity